jgi:tryptophan synthase alpha chain
MELEIYLRQRQQKKELLLMTHIVVGYPSFTQSWALARAMVDAGVDVMELQIPFSEPIADGPVIAGANQQALAHGSTVEKCFEFAAQLTEQFDIPFLFMSYYNILFKHGVSSFTQRMQRVGVAGAIVPDLPPEEGEEYLSAMREQHLSPVFIVAPTTSDERMKYLAERARGMVYCVSRKGVTGTKTALSNDLEGYLARCRGALALPLAVGFGIQQRADVDFLRGKADIAVVGSETLRVFERGGVSAVSEFLKSLMA